MIEFVYGADKIEFHNFKLYKPFEPFEPFELSNLSEPLTNDIHDKCSDGGE